MRVYHLIKGLGRGGAEMLLPEGLREADRASFEYSVGYFLPHKDALVPALEASGTSVKCFSAKGNGRLLAQVPRVARFVKRWRADLIHCHLPMAGVAGRLAGKMAGIPVVYTEHNLQERYHPLTARANQATWSMQKRVIACSQGVADSIATHRGDKVPVDVVQNGVSLTQFQRDLDAGGALREELGIDPKAPVMGSVAVFRSQKRLVEWMRVARGILDSVPEARFLLVGDGPLREEIEAERTKLGLDDHVKMPGLLTDVRPWLSAMNAYVMSSEFEGLPIAMLEAMACELPAVCTDVGGIREVVREGVDGHLVAPENPLDLVAPLVEMFRNPKKMAQMGAEARNRVEEGFGMKRMMGELEAIYRKAVAEGS